MLAAGHDPPTDDGLLRGVLSDDPYGLRGAAASTTAQLVSTLRGLSDRTDGFFGVHRFRWDRMAGGKAYLAADVRSALAGYDAGQDLAALLPDGFTSADPRHRAQLIDIETLLRGYLLSSQGDRMAMAHSVENRVPFLDHTLVEYLARVPPDAKLVGFVEKKPLRDLFAGVLPPRVLARRKHPYTAPSLAALFEPERDYVTDLLSPSLVARFGIFDPAAVAELVRRCRTGIWPQDHYVSLPVCVLSVQLLCHTFIAGYQRRAALTISYDLVDRRVSHVDGAAADAR
jgi:asparagine synthase (glutamine-hydrolysing)